MPVEEVIAHFAERLFPGIEIVEQSLFRVTRDADFELSDEADDLLEAVESELRRRRFGDAVRLEVSDDMSASMRERLYSGLGVTDGAGLRHARPDGSRRPRRDRGSRPAGAEA